MKPSELMREGIKDKQQIRKTYIQRDWEQTDRPINGCCALGAILVGLINAHEVPDYDEGIMPSIEKLLEVRFHELYTQRVNSAGHFSFENDIYIRDAIVILNDDEDWSIERIADWLQEIGL